MHTIKKSKNNKIIAFFATFAIVLSLGLSAAAFLRPTAKAEDDNDIKDITEYTATSLGLSNNNFDSSAGSYPASPSNWTGAPLGGNKGDNVVKGIVDLSASAYSGTNSGNKKFKLDQYPEYASESNKPVTIFGENSTFAGSDTKALMINTMEGARVAYGYKSPDMTFKPNSFYRISVWAKTGDFGGADRMGATIKLSGLGQNVSFQNINTVRNIQKDSAGIPILNADNNYGWKEYAIYVRSSASLTKTVKLVLALGDAVEGTDEDPTVMPSPATGYVFFDTVTAEQISAHAFATETSLIKNRSAEQDNVYYNPDGTEMAVNLDETKSFAVNDKEIGTFSQNTESWDTNVYYDEYESKHDYLGTSHVLVYNSESRIPDLKGEDNVYGFTQNPWAPFGRAEYKNAHNSNMFAGTGNANIMMISTYNGKEFETAARGIGSPVVKIERYKYYRFSVWVKGDSLTGGNGISILLKGKRSDAQNYNTLSSEYINLTGDSSDSAHYGWKQQVVYLRGSMLADYDVKFELWLGSPTAKSSGIAMFDNVTFTNLKYSDYSAMSGADGGFVYKFDESENTTNITNGNFMAVGDMEETTFPLPVADWTFHNTADVTAQGFSNVLVDTDGAAYGILPTDSETFNRIAQEHKIPGVVKPATSNLTGVLLLSSYEKKTAYCYQSPSITLSTDKYNKLTVDLCVNNIVGYGASLVLKTTDGKVVSTIENITDTANKFKQFTFYLAAPRADKSVYLEIWLGLNDRTSNNTKLSSGNVYVSQVALNEWTAASEDKKIAQEYREILAKYKTDITSRNMLKNMNYGVFSFAEPTIDYYDAYTYANDTGYGHLYQWSRQSADTSKVVGGMFNADLLKDLTIYEGFSTKDVTGNMLYIFNTEANRTTYKYDDTLDLVSNMYYRIDVSVKVVLSPEVRKDSTHIGANILLTGTSAQFKNIKDTTTIIDPSNENSRDAETFKTYSFYIATGSNGGKIGLEISFGGENSENYIQGKLIVGGITMTEIDNLDYEDAQKNGSSTVTAIELSDIASDTDSSNTEAVSSEVQWWIIPTVIFGVALLSAIALIIFVRVRDRIKSKRKVVYASEYDRNDVMRDLERLQAQKDRDDAMRAQYNTDSQEHSDDDIAAEYEPHEIEEITDVPEQSPAPEKHSEPQRSDDLDD